MDFTGPFEVLSRVPGSHFHVVWKDMAPITDIKGLRLLPDTTLEACPQLDVLIVPGGFGQEELMDDDAVISFLRKQAAGSRFVFSVCTGALLCGAAGLLNGVKATTHWSAFHLLPYFGAVPVDRRVVVDGKIVSAAGVTSGIEGALQLAAMLCGDTVAQVIQLSVQYAPEPPFSSGTPATAPSEVFDSARELASLITARRLETAKRFAAKLADLKIDRG